MAWMKSFIKNIDKNTLQFAVGVIFTLISLRYYTELSLYELWDDDEFWAFVVNGLIGMHLTIGAIKNEK